MREGDDVGGLVEEQAERRVEPAGGAGVGELLGLVGELVEERGHQRGDEGCLPFGGQQVDGAVTPQEVGEAGSGAGRRGEDGAGGGGEQGRDRGLRGGPQIGAGHVRGPVGGVQHRGGTRCRAGVVAQDLDRVVRRSSSAQARTSSMPRPRDRGGVQPSGEQVGGHHPEVGGVAGVGGVLALLADGDHDVGPLPGLVEARAAGGG